MYISQKKNPFRNRWHPKRERFAWGPDVQPNKSNKQPIYTTSPGTREFAPSLEFGVHPTTDFRFTHGANHGLGNVFIYVSRYGPTFTGMGYRSLHGKFADEGDKASQGKLV